MNGQEKQQKANRSIMRLCSSVLIRARNFFYPPLCVLCDSPLSPADPWLCPGCIEKLDYNAAHRNACPRCSQNRTRHRCACEFAWDYPFERVFSFFDFDETVKEIAHHFKYKGRKALAYHIGRRYASRIPRDFFDGIDGAVAIPLHFMRRMKRGYNQAEHFAHGVLSSVKPSIPFLQRALRRTRHTQTQTKLDKEQREKNLKGVFAVAAKDAERIRNKKLILFDDVVTTGATTGHCTRALRAAGASEVRVLSMARD